MLYVSDCSVVGHHIVRTEIMNGEQKTMPLFSILCVLVFDLFAGKVFFVVILLAHNFMNLIPDNYVSLYL